MVIYKGKDNSKNSLEFREGTQRASKCGKYSSPKTEIKATLEKLWLWTTGLQRIAIQLPRLGLICGHWTSRNHLQSADGPRLVTDFWDAYETH